MSERFGPSDGNGSWWSRWWPLTLGPVAALALAAVATLGAFLNLTDFAAGGNDVVLGTLCWALAAAVLGGGVALPPGPARRARAITGVVIGVAWLILGLVTFITPSL